MRGYTNKQKKNKESAEAREDCISNLEKQSEIENLKIFTNCKKILVSQPQNMTKTIFSLENKPTGHMYQSKNIEDHIFHSINESAVKHKHHVSSKRNCDPDHEWINALLNQNNSLDIEIAHDRSINNEYNNQHGDIHCNINCNSDLHFIFPQVETPPSAISDDMYFDLYKETPHSVDINTFMNSKDCRSMIITAVIFKLIATNNPSCWMKYFDGFVGFIPKILLLGYVFLMRLLSKIRLESIKEIVDSYFVCCLIANKSLRDRHSNVSTKNVKNINTLEAFVLNNLEYDMDIDLIEVRSAIIEIKSVDMLMRFNLPCRRDHLDIH